MKKILVFILAFISVSWTYGQITSTTAGGNWSSPATWVGGVVPNAQTDVVIKGTVVHSNKKDACRNLAIKQGAVLTTLSSSLNGWPLNVHGNLVNNGTIRNNDAGDWLQLRIHKNVVNNGIWVNYGVSLVGDSEQTFSGTRPFSPYFIGTENDKPVVAGNDITFQGTTLLFWKKNKFVVGQGKTVTFSYSSLHKRSTPFMPPDNTAQNVHFTGKGKVQVDEKYKLSDCVYDGTILKK